MTSKTPRTLRMARIGLPLLTVAAFATACGTSAGSTAGGPATQTGNGAPTAGAAIELTAGHLTDATGRTVYLWVADSTGKSTCNGACASVWPPVPAAGTPTVGSGLTASELTTITRSDGSTQLAYAGHPLYYFEADKSAGDSKGQGSDGFGAKWWELTSEGQPITASSPAPQPTASASTGGGGYGY